MVGAAGFEPATSCSQGRRANQAALRPDGMLLEQKRLLIALCTCFRQEKRQLFVFSPRLYYLHPPMLANSENDLACHP